MKKALGALCLLVLVTVSCTKDSDENPAPTATNTELLTNNTWQVKEIIQQSGNVQGRYVMGGINTVGADYSKVRLSFNANGTGTSTDPLNATYTLTWAFAPGDETKMTVVINYPTPATLNYAFIDLDENNFKFTIYFAESGVYYLGSTHYIPFP